jgi:hypothetical protein
MPGAPFESFAQNGEDVVLWRALGHVAEGRYVDFGTRHPAEDSVSRAFYDHGWRGITVAPLPHLADLLRGDRPDDQVIEAGPSPSLDDILEGAGWAGGDVHFLSIDALDVEESEVEVLKSLDLERWRPWVVAIASVPPDASGPAHLPWEDFICSTGYRLALFDGRTRFYVASERDQAIGEKLAAPANTLDNFTTWRQRKAIAERDEAVAQSVLWRSVALERWNDRMGESSEAAGRMAEQYARLHKEYEALLATVSWRVTKPLRAIHERFPKHKGGE